MDSPNRVLRFAVDIHRVKDHPRASSRQACLSWQLSTCQTRACLSVRTSYLPDTTGPLDISSRNTRNSGQLGGSVDRLLCRHLQNRSKSRQFRSCEQSCLISSVCRQINGSQASDSAPGLVHWYKLSSQEIPRSVNTSGICTG